VKNKLNEYDFYCVTCGKSLQDNEHEYCSTCYKKREYKALHEDIINIDPQVRFSTICDMDAKVTCSRHRQGAENLLTPEESKRCLEQAVNMWKSRNQLASKVGKGKYVLAEYETIKRITMPLDDNHLIYVTADVKADHAKIIDGIMTLKARLK